jgi:SAM-dependent methyltransferase
MFSDPTDTEVGVWAACDLITSGCLVLDLGCGSGAAAAAFLRFGAGVVIGIDISDHSIAWAQRHYAAAYGDRLLFAEHDYRLSSTSELVSSTSTKDIAVVLASNPPYVPLPTRGSHLKSIYAGEDGLQMIPDVLRHALTLNADIGLTIGSYSSPRRVLQLLLDSGYGVTKITLAALELGDFTRRNPENIVELEKQGEAVLWRGSATVGYLVVGLSCKRGFQGRLSPNHLMQLLGRASMSRCKTLELVSVSCLPEIQVPPVRILVLPEKMERHHC